jgi:anti-sigma B factor antagonist
MAHEIRHVDGCSVVSLRGEVDLEHSPAAREVLLSCVRSGRDLAVDLSGVEYIDSSGIASLVEAFQEARRRGSRFSLVAVSPAALRVFELARLDRVFTIHETLEEALGRG